MYDIVFISYYEPNADDLYKDLYTRYNSTGVFGDRVKRVKNVKGIHNAHIEAAKIANTDYFYVVDGDAEVLDSFNFDYIVPNLVEDIVHVWTSINPINDLAYGYGGVKLLPTQLTRNLDTSSSDMTTSISKNFKVMNEVSNITFFNTDEFSTWKSAFRECAKLSSKVIDRQDEGETNERLKIWTTKANGRFCEYAIRGARAGMEFGLSSGADLRLINDFDWLKERFNA